ncbi:OCIA domain-containing protein asrij [Leptinotarsa decemlineata]|uniref:OCIA domain-containing protein asrij n=1 Tax=Leptinotarsa decemlineata TaxID=7539 RepID=UPI003D30846F
MIQSETDVEAGGNQRRPFQDPQASQKIYKFTAEELKVIKECNRDSFYQRCLPLSAVLAGSAYYGVKTGFLKANQRFGAVPKVIASVFAGYFIGKFSYQSKCAERLMQLPNSQLGEILRQKRRGNLKETVDPGFGPGMSLAPFSGMGSADTYTDLNPNNSLDLDTDRPEIPGLDDYNRPSIDNPIYEEEMPPIQKHTTTYDELRKQNREEYQNKRVGNYRQPAMKLPSRNNKDLQDLEENEFSVPKNKYGDM